MKTLLEAPAETGQQSTLRAPSKRMVSVDVLRGITIAFMILVNDGERGSYGALHHADWNGWTPTDLVFPTFLFLVGITIVFSTESRLARGASKFSLLAHTFRRFAILFLLGLVVNGFPYFHLGTLRIYGVLQRIAICYLIASLLYLWDKRPASKVAIVIAALVGYWVLLRWVPVPGCGMPGRDIPFLDKTCNLTSYVDRHVFPAARLYHRVRDPEGLLSDLPSVASTLLGMLTAMWLRSKRTPSRKAWGMLAAGIVGVALGLLWGRSFPINKNLWTSTFVLFAGGCSLIGLAICYWAIDIKNWKKGWTYIWIVFGMNAITAYVFSELFASAVSQYHLHTAARNVRLKAYVFDHWYAHIPSPHLAALAYSLTTVAVSFVLVLILYRKKIFLKV